MTHTWLAEHVLVAYKSTQWLEVADVLLAINLEGAVVLVSGSKITLTCVVPWLSSSVSIFLVPSVCSPGGICQPKHI